MTETPIRMKIFQFLGSLRDIKIFRNNVGQGFLGAVVREGGGVVVLNNYRRVKFGLHEGSGDLIGLKSTVVTPQMVGKKVAVFLSVEVKTASGTINPEQKNWMTVINESGGIAIVARSTEDAKLQLEQQLEAYTDG